MKVESFRGGYWLNVGVGAQANVKGHYLNFEIVPNATQDLDGHFVPRPRVAGEVNRSPGPPL